METTQIYTRVYIDALAEVHARSRPHGPEAGDHDAPATASEGGSAPGSGDDPILEPPFGPDFPSGSPVGAPTPHPPNPGATGSASIPASKSGPEATPGGGEALAP